MLLSFSLQFRSDLLFCCGSSCYLWSLQKGSSVPASKARIPPLGHEPMGFGHNDATVDIPLDTMNVMKFRFSLFTSTLEFADF